ncbi:hypothetical protein LXA43DRAFT_1019057 [Ganoderma leucocontextum]|nr:hypothetical protein LXA43DRAFT_1019057 [Ganoderma leucocontextum]
MWRHITGNSTDNGQWTTGKCIARRVPVAYLYLLSSPQGNGWAAAGMLRVLGMVQNSQYSYKMKKQSDSKDLVGCVSEIHNGINPHLVSSPWHST